MTEDLFPYYLLREPFAKTLKQLRIDSGKTQLEVADFCDVSRECVAKWETGTENICFENIFKLARFYGKEAGEILPLISEVKIPEKKK